MEKEWRDLDGVLLFVDPGPSYGRDVCDAVHRNLFCTRWAGHSGRHAAQGTEQRGSLSRVLAVWGDE